MGSFFDEQPTRPFHSELIFRYVLRAMRVSGLYLEQINFLSGPGLGLENCRSLCNPVKPQDLFL